MPMSGAKEFRSPRRALAQFCATRLSQRAIGYRQNQLR
jgi:hypothetical protein